MGQRLAWRPMASSSTGRWVRRVGSAGGGRTYRRRRPVNYYGVIAVICVLGVSSVALARYDYRHPAGASAFQSPPTTQDTWYAALGISVCGDEHPALAPNPFGAASGFQAIEGGAIKINPKTSSQTGTNATLAAFVRAYPGLTVTPSALVLPPSGKEKRSTTLRSGSACPTGSKDAGKVGHVEIAYWRNLAATRFSTTSDPAFVRFSPNQLITIGFVPTGTNPPKPPASAISVMLSPPSTTTTLPVPSTTAPGHGATTTTYYGTTTTTRR